MTKRKANLLWSSINSARCYNEKSMNDLLVFVDKIKELDDELQATAEKLGKSPLSSFEISTLKDSERDIRNWIHNPKKRTMDTTFTENKLSLLDDVGRCITYGDKEGLWE